MRLESEVAVRGGGYRCLIRLRSLLAWVWMLRPRELRSPFAQGPLAGKEQGHGSEPQMQAQRDGDGQGPGGAEGEKRRPEKSLGEVGQGVANPLCRPLSVRE